MKTMFLAVLTAFLCVGCVTTRYVPIETVRTEYKTQTVHDSIIVDHTVHDSVIIRMQGDTVYVDRWHTDWRDRWRDRFLTDTIIRTDSIQVPYPVGRELTKWETFCLDYGKVMTGCTLVLMFLFLFIVVRWATGRK